MPSGSPSRPPYRPEAILSSVLVIHAAATLFMTGLVWFVQVAHYPLFAAVTGPRSGDYAAEHQRRTTRVVVVPMLLELVTAIAIALDPMLGPRPLAWAGLALVAFLWLSTALVLVPLHRRLLRGHEAATVRLLVRANAARTAAWTARSFLALALLAPTSG